MFNPVSEVLSKPSKRKKVSKQQYNFCEAKISAEVQGFCEAKVSAEVQGM